MLLNSFPGEIAHTN